MLNHLRAACRAADHRANYHANVAGSQFTVFRSMIERHYHPCSLTLLPPIVAITVAERRKLRTCCRLHAYFSTSAPRRASGLALMESTHTSDQDADILERLGPSWAGLFRNRGQRGTGWETPPRLGTSGRLPGRIVCRHQYCAATDLEASTA